MSSLARHQRIAANLGRQYAREPDTHIIEVRTDDMWGSADQDKVLLRVV